MGNKKQKLSKVKKNRGNVSSLLNWQTHRIQKTLTIKEIEEVERRTVGQHNNNEWQKYRKSRLTAFNFGKVCKLRASTSRANTVKNILYDIFQGNSATRYAASPDGLIGKDTIVEIKCPQSFVVDKILRDEEFWKNNIGPQCTKFYMESLVPEIIDSRFDRGLPIRSGLPEP
ncbi:Restriction endonuclease type II-like,Exonuclease, phage-type/RecB, C-terminal [Cinara cedri]|uniref:Restriction endonuclease type II-like,Exonuclease, phage-type/RecB, C-terminal n=1 Tax=Cinara cedri TaxID=506608 RepID=A0A5E4M653_9HEMI|nr:Restriction endonuclease type II-like,Exonuclease, phage-type/RecB, C-terminal [Cinara cedri]